MTVTIDLQLATAEQTALPAEADFMRWAEAALAGARLDGVAQAEISEPEITVRIVDEDESRQLNHDYRGKDKPTNVLSFPFDGAPPGVSLPLLGDLVICHSVVATEAAQQDKPLVAHWAHMVIHGTLHLLGYDHVDNEQAEQMEQRERDILATLGIDDPYAADADQ